MMKCNSNNLKQFERFCQNRDESMNRSTNSIKSSRDIYVGSQNLQQTKKNLGASHSFSTLEPRRAEQMNVHSSQQMLPKLSTIEFEKRLSSIDNKSSGAKMDSYPKFMYNSIQVCPPRDNSQQLASNSPHEQFKISHNQSYDISRMQSLPLNQVTTT